MIWKKIHPIQYPTQWKSKFTTTIIPNKEMVLLDIAQDDPSLKVFTDGSGMNNHISTSTILYRNGRCRASLWYKLGPISHHTVYKREATGILLTTKLILNKSHAQSVIIYSDNRALILAVGIFGCELNAGIGSLHGSCAD